MKHFKRYGLLFLILCMMGVCAGCSQMTSVMGSIKQAHESRAIAKEAEEINERGFSVILDGETLDVSARMSEEMHLLIPIKEAVAGLKTSLILDEQSRCYVDGELAADDILKFEDRDAENVWVDVNLLAPVLGMTYEWKDSESAACIRTEPLSELPERYDLREYRTLNPVENQGTFGTCWAFASTAALEMMHAIEEGNDFSVDHMTMNNGFNISPTEGGDYNMAIAYLSAWRGPVSESDDPYGDGETNSALSAKKHLQEAQVFKEKNIDDIKRMVMAYGGVESPIYMSISHAWDASGDYEPLNSAYYYSGELEANHDVVIVGWDDHFSRENFNHMPEYDGAFICRNSWGEEFGNEGYFYVSYEDAVLGQQGVAYTRLENPDNYSRIYQSDMLGWVGTLGYGEESAWFANIYTTSQNETLKAISFYAVDDESQYDIYVVPEYTEMEDLSNRMYMGSGYCEYGGYYTIDLPEMISMDAGEQFAIVVCMTTQDCERPIAIEYHASDLTNGVVIDDGEGFVSHDGVTWASAEQEYDCNVCLKAFTD